MRSELHAADTVDDLLAGPGSVSIALSGVAWYEVSMHCAHGRIIRLALWTTRRGRITTRIDAPAPEVMRQTSHGTLQALTLDDCSLHLERRDRGHYWLGLEHTHGAAVRVDFIAPGHLKSRLLAHH